MERWIWFAVAVLMLDAVAYSVGAVSPIRCAMNPTDSYSQKRLLLNLMLANQGLYLGAAMAFAGTLIESKQHDAAVIFFVLTLATCIYPLVTVPVLTPRDSAHAIPILLAAVLIVAAFAFAGA